jgi:hypothetical protein
MSMLLSACPSFQQTWERYTGAPEYDPELLYVHLGEFARHLLALYEADVTSEFAAVFRVVEDLHVHGDPQVREAATVGLLESLQNNAEHEDVEADAFLSFLGPESAKWWGRLRRFWDGDSAALRE